MDGLTLFLIDPQVDFCEPGGALFVPGAEQDIARLAAMVRRHAESIAHIHVSLDTHHALDVGHPAFWQDPSGNPPAPFTRIGSEDVVSGRWVPTPHGARDRMLAYTYALEAHGRYPLCIWPPHCLFGSPGHNIAPLLREALHAWETRRKRFVNYVFKGTNPWTEHYSALCADVPDPADPSTQPNVRLLEALVRAERVVVAGEAGSHCVANTVRDVARIPLESGPGLFPANFTLLRDAISPVPGFEDLQSDFYREMQSAGVRFATTESLISA